jgi:[glutamine synthetase] adenylyltransferase / [glutamine synthetase]-adenylyl-L-tyrosine phosphorylase
VAVVDDIEVDVRAVFGLLADQEGAADPVDNDKMAALLRTCRLSEYVLHAVRRYPDLVESVFSGDDTERTLETTWFTGALEPILAEHLEVVEFRRRLREFRRSAMVRIIYRDFSRRSDLVETTRDLSLLAEACIQVALQYHYEQTALRFGYPCSPSGVRQQMCVLALGKLGAQELNLSSDIDLIFLYDEQGNTDGGKQTSNQEFFLRASRQLIASLDETTPEGFVFRVDMRLRPFGESSPLIQHRAAMENYFLEHGRDWERYAFIKARAVAGDVAFGARFLDWLVPFVFRRHLDYGAIESLREMKLLINRQVELNDLHGDLKLGPGGIREIEFIAQAHQLIFGGTNEKLRERRLQTVLGIMADEQLLPSNDVTLLTEAYVFLRNSEHAIQGEKDKQTQMLPVDTISQQRLAEVMGFADYDGYYDALQRQRTHVRECFGRFMQSSESEQEMLLEGDIFWPSIWRDPASDASLALLSNAGFSDAQATASRLQAFTMEILQQDLQEIAQERINKLMPVLLSVVARQNNPDHVLLRVLPIIEAIERRSTYVSYLLENLDALKRTVDLCAMSPWVASRLNEFPILLYELTDRKTSEFSFSRQALESQLNDQLMALDPLDFETQMDTLRVFKNATVLRVAVCELLDLLPLMKASDALTAIAETLLQKSLDLAWRYLTDRHGQPMTRDGGSQKRQFAIVAYGKLGGIELAYGSDLDLVFLYEADIHGETNGKRRVNNNVFYGRLVQRIIHILTSFTRFGTLYEADMRLRPSGNKGPMVTNIAAFERYQENEAWTWEHQALIRARFVAGDHGLGDRFGRIRDAILQRQRDAAALKADVVDMREKMRSHIGGADSEQERGLAGFDLKHEIGAIVDIEFMVQYAVLSWAHQHPVLSRWTDMMRLLDEIRELGLLNDDEVELLQQAYLAYRAAVHYQWLGGEMSSFDTLQEYRQDVISLWQRQMLA